MPSEGITKKALLEEVKARLREKSGSPLLKFEVVSGMVRNGKLTRITVRARLKSTDGDPEGAEALAPDGSL